MIVPLEDLMRHINSRYKLTLIAAQRANELITGATPLVDAKSKKPSVIALDEIAKEKIRCEAKPEGKSKKS